MSACQSFKFAYLHAAAEAGLTLDEALTFAKEAAEGIKQGFSPANSLLGYIAAPLAAGAGVGYGAAKLRGLYDPEDDPQEIKTRETIEALRREALKVRLSNQLHGRQQQQASLPSRPLLR